MSKQPQQPLAGLRVIECASFVAGPSGCMTLAQLGADVIRVDPIGGAPDFKRWPVSQRSADSLFWTGLNKGKRSVTLDLRRPEGRELLLALATGPGPESGILVDNQVGRSWLAYERLAERRADVIQVRIGGSADGRPAVDYTVNPEVGVPEITGPAGVSGPVNHVLPAWDLLTGMTATTALLASLRHRELTGEGAYLEVALGDVALAGLANMGWYAEADELAADRPKVGNYLYGSYGVDFQSADGHRVMVVALTSRQWHALLKITGTSEVFAALERALGVNLAAEGDRYRQREAITAILRPWFEVRSIDEVSTALSDGHALWSRYRSMSEVVEGFRRAQTPSVLADVEQPGIGRVVSARSAIRIDAHYGATAVAPSLGQHTDEVLEQFLGLSPSELGKLHDDKVIGEAV
ncbi:CoA transferase [Arthrobacter sp. MA-N2]|uniref:CoA transferase n=1 Tax=Arthrobacter sp. MA-N2 TaxID=1101188 RepID=UPI000483FE9E|nr:CoA transferase [Arthrobacter sp. MA-N2]